MIDPNDGNDEEVEGHVDEKWLISYSDMMTLLFGFFVMMYVMAMQNKGTIEERLKKVSKDGFKESSAQMDPGVTQNEKTKEEVLIEIDEVRTELQIQSDELISVKKELENLISEKTELEKSKEDLENEVESLSQKLVESATNKNAIEFKDDSKLKRKLASLTVENEMLEERLAKLDAQADKKFLMIYTQWETEKHDVDMIVEDPKGHIFNYRKRSFGSVAGEFVIDSRFGPGIETWITNNIIPGEYKLTVRLYNQYGNKSDAIVKTSVYFNNQIIKLPELKLNTTKETEKLFKLVVTENGEFTII